MRNSHCAQREVVLIAIDRLVNISIDTDTFAVSVSSIRLYGSTGSGIAILFRLIFADIFYRYNQKKKYNILFNS